MGVWIHLFPRFFTTGTDTDTIHMKWWSPHGMILSRYGPNQKMAQTWGKWVLNHNQGLYYTIKQCLYMGLKR